MRMGSDLRSLMDTYIVLRGVAQQRQQEAIEAQNKYAAAVTELSNAQLNLDVALIEEQKDSVPLSRWSNALASQDSRFAQKEPLHTPSPSDQRKISV